LLSEKTPIDDAAPVAFVDKAMAELRGLPNVRLMLRTAIFGVYDDCYGAIERVGDHWAQPAPFAPRQIMGRIMAKRAGLAAGALDRPIVFGGNDRPGVMLAAPVQTYVNRFGVAPGLRMAFFANHDAAWTAAVDAADAGAEVAAMIDPRGAATTALLDGAKSRGLRVILGGEVFATHGKVLSAIDVYADGKTERLAVDGLAMSSGFSPNVHLTCHHGGKPQWNESLATFVPGNAPRGMLVAGAANEAVDIVSHLPAHKVSAALGHVAQRYARVLRINTKALAEALQEARDVLRKGSADPTGQRAEEEEKPATTDPATGPAVTKADAGAPASTQR